MCTYKYVHVYMCVLYMTLCVLNTAATVFPNDKFVTITGSFSVFCCSTTSPTATIVSVEWFINDVTLDSLTLTNVTTSFSTIGGGVGSLFFRNLPLD